MNRNESKPILRLISLLAVVLVGLSTMLIAFRVEQVLLEFAQGRGTRTANQLREQVEGGFRLGISLSDQSNLNEWLKRLGQQDPSLVFAHVQSDSGEMVADWGDRQQLAAIRPVWSAQLLGRGNYSGSAANLLVRNIGHRSYIGIPVADAAATRVASIWLVYDRSNLRDSAWSLLGQLWLYALGLTALLIGTLSLLASAWLRLANARMQSVAGIVSVVNDNTLSKYPCEIVKALDQSPSGRTTVWKRLILVGLALIIVFAGLSALAWKARELARPLIISEIDSSARIVLQSAQAHITRAIGIGIPANKLLGLEEVFSAEIQSNTEVAFIALRTQGDRTATLSVRPGVSEVGRQRVQDWLSGQGAATDFRIETQPLVTIQSLDALGNLSVGTPLAYIDERMRSISLDLFFAIIVSFVLLREVLGAMWARSAIRPYLIFEDAWQGWKARAERLSAQYVNPLDLAVSDWFEQVRSGVRRLIDEARQGALTGKSLDLIRIRMVVFLTALSDELLRPFFTVYASEVNPVSIHLSPTMLAGLPVAAFMVSLALAQPLGPWVTRRFEMHRALLFVSSVGALLLGATAFTTDGLTLILLRIGSGVVYGLMLILLQTAIVRTTNQGQRARGLAEVSAAIVAAGVCGPALGGLLVEKLGTSAAFFACALCLLAAAVISLGLSVSKSDGLGNLAGLGGWNGLKAVLSNRTVIAVTWLAAIPARLAAAALLVVVTPLYLLELGESATIAGRVLLLYFLAFMITAPIVARQSDLSGRRKPWIVGGCILSAVACAALPLVGGVIGAAICCGLLGVAQALLSSPQLALVTEIFDGDHGAASPEQALAAFRFVERFGSILAPFAVALAVTQFGLTGAVGAIGAVLAVCGVGLSISLMNLKESTSQNAEI